MAEYIEREAAKKAEYIEREAAKKAFYNGHTVQSLCERGANTLGEAFSIILDEVPATDVRPVILCRDCKHWETSWTPQGVSDGRHYCAPLDLYPSADWFCADGEKREES